ncbi:hypothetical protein IWZ03DRAFT_61370 [Phyllosticta citriasiana]|uniref:Zn(2)-C6 fungal-type domain-containing protein n=1 Tax=Phyllosticta citriasiana TaxID=595635 RepID=A0ABR1KDV2_9PEZI
MRSSIACARCRRSKVKCVNNGVGTTCRACETTGRECTYPSPAAAGAGASVAVAKRDSNPQAGNPALDRVTAGEVCLFSPPNRPLVPSLDLRHCFPSIPDFPCHEACRWRGMWLFLVFVDEHPHNLLVMSTLFACFGRDDSRVLIRVIADSPAPTAAEEKLSFGWSSSAFDAGKPTRPRRRTGFQGADAQSLD